MKVGDRVRDRIQDGRQSSYTHGQVIESRRAPLQPTWCRVEWINPHRNYSIVVWELEQDLEVINE